MHLSRGGHQRPVTSTCVDGYRPRLTPRNLDMILAKGQSSADLILTEAQEASRISGSPSPPSMEEGGGGGRPLPRLESSGDRSTIGK